MTHKVCIISGVGPGTGTALARRFGEGGYRVAMLARDVGRLEKLKSKIPGSEAFGCDVSDEAQVIATAKEIRATMGAPSVLIHNAVGGTFGSFLDIDPAELDSNFQTNVMGFLYLAREFAPQMAEEGSGAIIVTGNSASLRGKSKFAGFAPTKAAQRILAESIARDLGPKGVHVAYMVVDAVIDLPWTQDRFNSDRSKPEGYFIKPASIAEEAWHITHQPRDAWSFNVEIRPHMEVW